MKLNKVFVPTVLAAAIALSGCYGSMSASGSIYKWNSGIGDKWPRTLVFAAFWILPVYELSMLGDILIFNTIEFWGGGKVFSGGWTSSAPASSGGESWEASNRPYELRYVDETQVDVYRGEDLVAVAQRTESGDLEVTDPKTLESRRFTKEDLMKLREMQQGHENPHRFPSVLTADHQIPAN